MSYNSGYATIQVAFVREEEEGWGGVGGGGLDKLCKLFWGVNIFSAPGMGRVSPKLVGQKKNAPALPLIFDWSLNNTRRFLVSGHVDTYRNAMIFTFASYIANLPYYLV